MGRWGKRADLVGREVQFGYVESTMLLTPSSISSSSEAGFSMGITSILAAFYLATSGWDWVPNSFMTTPEHYTNVTIFQMCCDKNKGWEHSSNLLYLKYAEFLFWFIFSKQILFPSPTILFLLY